MQTKAYPFLFCLLLIFVADLACVRNGQSPRFFNHAEFRFEYPARWQAMSELWEKHQLQEDFYGLGAQELVALTSVRKKGKFGIWFSVAKKPLAGASLEDLVENTYAQIAPGVVDWQQFDTQLDGNPAIAVRYRRPWGEPWWEFYDLWVDRKDFAYLLSFHALSLGEYQADIDLILQSFSFEP